jgi:hypothetical protein
MKKNEFVKRFSLVTSTFQKIGLTGLPGTLEKALDLPLLALRLQRRQAAPAKAGRNPFDVKHDRLFHCRTALLMKSSVPHPISTKPAFQDKGSVPGGSANATVR